MRTWEQIFRAVPVCFVDDATEPVANRGNVGCHLISNTFCEFGVICIGTTVRLSGTHTFETTS
jgi:hypothetical protein